LADGLAEGEEHVARLRAALRSLRVQVPKVYVEASGPHVLAMAVAEGRSLKEVLDVISQGGEKEAQKAAAWFAALLLFVIVPLWGKMLLVVGCCHADPHPGNFKVDGIPGLEAPPAATGDTRRPGLWGRLRGGGCPEPEVSELSLWVLDWGSCVDLDDDVRKTLCRLLVSLSSLRQARRTQEGQPGADRDDPAREAAATAMEAEVAACIRALGVQAEEDAFLAALGMALFDPAVATSHPQLRGGRAEEEMGRSFPANSSIGKVLRVVAILVGICREMERRLNNEAAGRVAAARGSGSGEAMEPANDRPFVELFLVELWRPFAEEGLA